jgi:D-alanyl-D-alanine carboxypeptidase (penicillin-binding protein 5/6)
MSAHILNSYDPRKRGAGGAMGRPHGRFPAKRKVLFVFLAFFVLTLIPLPVSAKRVPAPQGEEAVAAYIVKETGSSEFLKSKEVDTPRSPASLTKIMTCLLAIESGRMNDVVTIPLEATQVEPTKAGFQPGEQIRLRDLVKAAMVNSSNDAAFAIAIHLGGSLDAFVATMNARARALGMNHTFFTNPAGYDRGIYAGNRTTARDLMILTERAVRYPEFNAIAKLDRVTFNELSTGKIYSLHTHNKLLERYPYSVGIKTGYTSMAGPCLIARALRDGKDMLIIMLGARTDRWSLASTMFDQGFGIDAGPVQVAETAVKSPRKVAVAAPEDSHSNVIARRARALEALRLKVESRRDQSAVTEIRGMSMDIRPSGAASSVKARLEKRKACAAIKSRGKSSRADRIALKASKKASARKQQLAKAKERNLKNRVALKSAKKSESRKVALKSANKERHAIKMARKGAARRSTADAKSAKSRSGKEGLSLSDKADRSPNG